MPKPPVPPEIDVVLRDPNPAVVATLSPDAPTHSRPSSGAGQVADAGAWLGEGLEPIGFDAGRELGQRSPDQTEMDRADDGLVGRCHLLEGTALQHDLLAALRSPELGPEPELLVETNDLVDRLLLRDRRKRGRLADEVRTPHPSSLLGASTGVALRAEGAGEDLRKEAIAGERAFVGRLGRGLVEDARPARPGALLASCRDEACLGQDAKVRPDGVEVQTDARAERTGIERRLSLLQDLEDSHTAWVAECAMERRTLLSGCLIRRLCHDRIVSLPVV